MDRAVEAARRSGAYGVVKRPPIIASHEEAQRAGALELPIRDRARRVRLALVAQARSEVAQVRERGEQQPWPKARFLAHELASDGIAPPHERAAIRLGPHRDDAGRIIPAPQPFVCGAHAPQVSRWRGSAQGIVFNNDARAALAPPYGRGLARHVVCVVASKWQRT